MSGDLVVEGTGESVDEARSNALRDLKRRYPGIDPGAVSIQVVSEGQRGLLGVGFEPARVIASCPSPGAEDASSHGTQALSDSADGATPGSRRLAALLDQIADGLGIAARIDIVENDGTITGTFVGDDLGLLIGRHGQTIDAIQTLAGAIVNSTTADRISVIVDAAGYRERRQRTLESIALRGAEEAARTGGRVSLEVMTAAERKLVHTYLQGHPGVVTGSEGLEPNRYVVVEPGEAPASGE